MLIIQPALIAYAIASPWRAAPSSRGALAHVRLLEVQGPRGPSSSYDPLEVIAAQLSALQVGSDEELDRAWEFVDPDGPLALAHSSSAGARSRWKWEVRREPRWRQIGARPMAALFRHSGWSLTSVMEPTPHKCIVRVRAHPWFPDAPHAESEATFQWELVKQPEASPAASSYEVSHPGCWLVHQIEADFGGWQVHK